MTQDQPPSSKRKVEAEDAEMAPEAESSTAEVPTSDEYGHSSAQTLA